MELLEQARAAPLRTGLATASRNAGVGTRDSVLLLHPQLPAEQSRIRLDLLYRDRWLLVEIARGGCD